MFLFGYLGDYGRALEGWSPWNYFLRQKYTWKLLAQKSHIRPWINRCWLWEVCSRKRSYAHKPHSGPQMGHFTSSGLYFLKYKIRRPKYKFSEFKQEPAELWAQLHVSYLTKPLEGTRRLGDLGISPEGTKKNPWFLMLVTSIQHAFLLELPCPLLYEPIF